MYCVSLLGCCIITKLLYCMCTLYTTAAPKPIGQTVSSTHVVITWQKVESTDEENPVTNYIINNSSSDEPITLPPDSEYYNVTGLSPGREYTVKVAAKNAIGVGRSADYVFNTTGEDSRRRLFFAYTVKPLLKDTSECSHLP